VSGHIVIKVTTLNGANAVLSGLFFDADPSPSPPPPPTATMPVTINDSAVADSPGWGIVSHSSNVNVTNNVVFNATGAAFVTEAGDETGIIDHNIAIHSQGARDSFGGRNQVQDFGFDGEGFWLSGGNVSV